MYCYFHIVLYDIIIVYSQSPNNHNLLKYPSDTAEACYLSRDIAKHLSDVFVYTEPVKFSRFKV